MAYELFTSWQDYREAFLRILPLAKHRIRIYDGDLAKLGMDKPEAIAHLQAFLAQGHSDALQIALRDTTRLVSTHPRLLTLLGRYGHTFQIYETPASLGHLKDSMVLVDDSHGLVRFHEDQPRSKLLSDDPDACAPYCQRFEALWHEGGEHYTLTPVGL